jgi:DinB superfamily
LTGRPSIGPRLGERQVPGAPGRDPHLLEPAVPEHNGQVDEAVGYLSQLWNASAQRLRDRCAGLTDEEFFWEPAPDCWNVRPDPNAPSGWSYEYEFAPPTPAPVTTIAWRLVHIAADNWIYWEHAFGPGVRNFPDLYVPSSAETGVQNWQESRRAITDWLESASDEDLDELRPSHLGEPRRAGEVVSILIDEQIHHGAEIALLRDLFVRRSDD